MTQAGDERLGNIQALRAAAALSVVLHHVIGGGSIYGFEPGWILPLYHWHGWGVHAFFVVSGFIMVEVQRRRHRGPGGFIVRRLIRILPLYWALTLLFGAIYLAAPEVFVRSRLSVEGVLASLGFLSQVSGWEYPVIGVGWTLEYEMLFYLLFALAIPIRDPRLATAAVTGALLVGVLVFEVGAIALEFPAGMALALLWRARGTGPRRTEGLAALGLGLFGLSLVVWVGPDALAWIVDHQPLVYGAISVALVQACLCLPQTRARLPLALGDASYSIYLLQVFAIPAVLKPLSALPAEARPEGPALAVLILTLTSVAGWLSWRLFERPSGAFLTARLERRGRRGRSGA